MTASILSSIETKILQHLPTLILLALLAGPLNAVVESLFFAPLKGYERGRAESAASGVALCVTVGHHLNQMEWIAVGVVAVLVAEGVIKVFRGLGRDVVASGSRP